MPASPVPRWATYSPLLLGQAGQPKCPNNKPNAESTLECPGAKRVIIQIQKAPIWIQFGYYARGVATAGLGSITWLNPQPFLPMVAALNRDFDAVRVWNFEAVEAEVILNPA